MTKEYAKGFIENDIASGRRTDYLYRISLKGLIRNETGEVLVVKENGRKHWDLPGGGIDHGENIKAGLARELKEEVNLEGDFSYNVISIDDPRYLDKHDFWQIHIFVDIKPENMTFSAGEDGDEVAFMDPMLFKDSSNRAEKSIYENSMFGNQKQ